jgi:hypothetical protein
MNHKRHKKILSASAKKFIKNQKFIHEYLIGNKTIEELNKKEIKISTPIKENIDDLTEEQED